MIYYRRLLHDKLISGISQNKIRLIFGARQTGKTVLLKEIMSGYDSVVYNLQDSSLRRRLERDPSVFTREIMAARKSATHIFIDEIQKIPALLDEIQFLYDQDKTRYQFFLTGSSLRKLVKESANLLPGRSHVFYLHPVLLSEEKARESYLDFTKPASGENFPERTLEQKLKYGNLPGIREETDESAYETLSAYVDVYLEEEIRKESLIRNTSSFNVFLQLAAVESGKQINLSKLSQESGIAISTIKNYYQVLSDTFLGYWLRSYNKSPRKRLITTPAFFFFDLGVRNVAAELRLNDSMLSTVGGPLLEHLVGLELLQRAGYKGKGYNVSFWRTVSGAEVDFIFETPGEDIPVEVKWTESPGEKHARNIEKFITQHPERAKRGLVICRIQQPQQLTENVTAIPFERL